jgi:urea transport system ATP-binding protein
MIKVSHLRKEFELSRQQKKELYTSEDKALAVDDLSFECHPGKVFSLLGPNGAGKTTFLDVITGKVQPTQGRVLFKGKDIRKTPEYKIACLGIGRKFQTPRVYLNLTVSENLDLAVNRTKNVWSTLFNKASAAEHRSIVGLLETIGLTPKAKLPAALLSHGEKQRLEIGMLVAQSPDLLLVDEPVAGLTDEETENVGALLLELAESHSIVVIEHDMEFVRQIARKVTVLHQGSVLCEGTMDEVQNDARVIEVYLGHESSLSPHQLKLLRVIAAVADADGKISPIEMEIILDKLSQVFADNPQEQTKLREELKDYLLQGVDTDLEVMIAEITDPEERQLILSLSRQILGSHDTQDLEWTAYQTIVKALNVPLEVLTKLESELGTSYSA